ncbi:MAG: hypothetical protein J3Q66DRAFT_375987 [Benniella sp.]|nr:MAG: hypothetical protein J3Q66DRAFT_375987 [Benniella sp.]
MAKNIFSRNVRLPTIPATSLEPETRLSDTRQLEQQDIFDPAAPGVTEVVSPAPVLERDDFRYLFKEFYSEIDQSGFLDVAPTRGTCSSTGSDGLDSDDLVKILTLLSTGLKDTLQQSAQHLYQLTHFEEQIHWFEMGRSLTSKNLWAEQLYQLACLDKPEQDTIPKQLRKCEFTEPQIRELKLHHAFILIHGYDEHQQTNNLYASNRLNQLGEWRAKMVISCRSEYLGVDYRDRFQPEDRNA